MTGLRCSSVGCTSLAVFRLAWRNPRIHAADRTKIWLACVEHRDHLVAFLTARAFPVAIEPIDDLADDRPAPAA